MSVYIEVIFLLITCIFFSRTSVECSNRSQNTSSRALERVKLADNRYKKNDIPKLTLGLNKTSSGGLTSGKNNVKEDKVQHAKDKVQMLSGNKDLKLQKRQGDRFPQKSAGNKKPNVIVDKGKITDPNFRGGKQGKQEQWPKLQKSHFRENTNSETLTRFTKMNMMQMDDATTTKSPTNELIASPPDGNINEVLSPYFMKEQMTRIAAKFTKANTTVEVIGRTLEYNDIVLMKMTQVSKPGAQFRVDDTKKYVDDAAEKKIIFIVHGLSVMGVLAMDCLTQEKQFVRLVSYYLQYLDLFDIFLMPMANPDGFGYKTEIWNKNLTPQDACPGVALDRNFDIAWNSSRLISSCSQQYPGAAPFSEPETRAIRDILHRYTHKIIAYIHVHPGSSSPDTFKGDAVLYPKGYTDVQSDDDKYIDLKGEIDEAMRKASFQIYSVTVDTLHNWYGKVSGTSVDYASSVYGIPYAMEFVMQLYEDESSTDQLGNIVLDEVWRRVIDVVMKNIWNSFHSNEV